jgi:hypothetical protein
MSVAAAEANLLTTPRRTHVAHAWMMAFPYRRAAGGSGSPAPCIRTALAATILEMVLCRGLVDELLPWTADTAENAANPLQNAKHEAVLQHYFATPRASDGAVTQLVYPNSSQRASETGLLRLLKSAEFCRRGWPGCRNPPPTTT